MKKTKTMRAAVLMLALALITTCFVGGTFAKYVATGSASEATARVARWGLDASNLHDTIVLDNLFVYEDTGVASSNTDKIIAPGTTNKIEFGFVFDDAEKPEVAYKLNVSTEGSTTSVSADLDSLVKWKLDSVECTNYADLLTKIQALSKEYAPNTLPGENASSHSIEWEWAFGDPTNNGTDTTQGSKAIAELEKITLKITVSAEQLDTYTA